MENSKGLNDLNSQRKTTVVVEFVFSDVYEKTSEINISQYVQTGFVLSLTMSDDCHWEKAPAAAIRTKKDVKTLIYNNV